VRARLLVTCVLVDDQDKALALSTNRLGFIPNTDVPVGQHRWPMVAEPDATHGGELLLEPNEHPAAKSSKDALVADGISFAGGDVAAAHRELEQYGVRFIPPRPRWAIWSRRSWTTPAAT
jgi:catechol 2,3-dioxygenase-like lactoylglutathione lyase family enzyme